MSPISSLPDEVLCSILARLGVSDLLRCAQVDRHFRDLVDHDVLLQYEAELTVHGMTDVCREDSTVAAKLARLRRYGQRFHRATFDCITLPSAGSGTDKGCTSFSSPEGSLVHFVRSQRSGTRCVVDELPSAIKGIQARRWATPLSEAANIDILAVDVALNLTVAIEHRSNGEVLVHFLTATEGHPHPLAAKPVIDATSTIGAVDGPDAYYHLQSVRISGTHVGWVIPGFSSGLDSLQCWNWRTGRMVWEQECDGLVGYTFLDGRYVLAAVHHDQESVLHIYDLRPPRQSEEGNATSTTNPVCSLGLPPARTGHVQVAYLQSRTPMPPCDTSAAFMRDPMSTAVVMQLTVGPDAEGATSDLLLLIPHRTLQAQIGNGFFEPCGASSDTQPEHIIREWNDWGPGATVMLNLPRKSQAAEHGGLFIPSEVWSQAFGSRLALLICDNADMASGHVVTFDVDPWAAKCYRRYRPAGCGGPGSALAFEEVHDSAPLDGSLSNVLNKLVMVPENVASAPTSVPFGVHVGPRVVFPTGQRPSRIITTHDGFAIALEGDDSEAGVQVFTV